VKTLKDGFKSHEKIAHKIFKDLGFKVTVVRKGKRLGYDFEIRINNDGEVLRQTVEAKSWKDKIVISHQLRRILEEDGILIFIKNSQIFKIKTKEDFLFKKEVKETAIRYYVKWA